MFYFPQHRRAVGDKELLRCEQTKLREKEKEKIVTRFEAPSLLLHRKVRTLILAQFTPIPHVQAHVMMLGVRLRDNKSRSVGTWQPSSILL